jgi:uncharacterized RDD family membrane protein YckC
MADVLRFETPENVEVQYNLAGLGSRFLAWFVDQLCVGVVIVVLVISLAIAGVSFSGLEDIVRGQRDNPERLGLYFIGLIFLVIGLGSLFYFTLTELLLSGQTIGKWSLGIRVVKADGFSLDPGSIVIRNVFRVLDNIPLMWVVPFLSKSSQRTGDMVAGTVVVSDEQSEITEVRIELGSRSAVEAEFRFDARALGLLQETDFEAVERLLDRWNSIALVQRERLAASVITKLAQKMQVPLPMDSQSKRFLEDLMAAELRRQERGLS